jgi:hypothetical protein
LPLAGDFACLVAEECAFDDVADEGLFVGVEAVDGFELEVEVWCWSAFVGVEDELVGGGGEGEGEVAEDVEGWLVGVAS